MTTLVQFTRPGRQCPLVQDPESPTQRRPLLEPDSTALKGLKKSFSPGAQALPNAYDHGSPLSMDTCYLQIQVENCEPSPALAEDSALPGSGKPESPRVVFRTVPQGTKKGSTCRLLQLLRCSSPARLSAGGRRWTSRHLWHLVPPGRKAPGQPSWRGCPWRQGQDIECAYARA